MFVTGGWDSDIKSNIQTANRQQAIGNQNQGYVVEMFQGYSALTGKRARSQKQSSGLWTN